MGMRRILATGRDHVRIHVQRPGRLRMQVHRESGLLACFAEGGLGQLASVRLLHVPSRLEPAVQLAVVDQRHPGAIGRDHHRARGEVRLRLAAREGSSQAPGRDAHALQIRRLLGIGGRMGREEGEQRFVHSGDPGGGEREVQPAAACQTRRRGGQPGNAGERRGRPAR